MRGDARSHRARGLVWSGVFRLVPFALPDALSFLAGAGPALFSVLLCLWANVVGQRAHGECNRLGVSMMPAMWPADPDLRRLLTSRRVNADQCRVHMGIVTASKSVLSS